MEKRNALLLGILFLVFALLFSSCNSDNSKGDWGENMQDSPGNVGDSTEIPVEIGDRKIIKTVRQTMRTREYEAFCTAMEKSLASFGGYVSSSHYYNGENVGYRSADFVLRVPAASLEAFLNTLGEKGRVVSYQDSKEDVTLAYVDVESRIKVLEAEEKALLSMLEGTTDISTLLQVRRQLSETQQDLASLRAQKKTYDDLIAYSTVYLALEETDYIPAAGEKTFFGTVGQNFVNSLNSIGRGFRGFGIWLFGRSPYILFFGGLGVGLFFLLRFLARRRTAGRGQNDGQQK